MRTPGPRRPSRPPGAHARVEESSPADDQAPQATAAGLVLALLLAAWALLAHPAAPGSVGTAGLVLTAVVGWALGSVGARTAPVLLAAGVASAVALVLATGLPGSLTSDAGAGPLGYANANAALVTSAVAILFAASRWVPDAAGRQKLLVAAVGFTVAAFATGSRAGAVSCLLLLLLWRFLPLGRAWVWQVASLTLLTALFALTVVLAVSYVPDHPTALTSTLSEARVSLWSDAVDLAETEPLTGIGAGEFASASEVARSDPDLRWTHSTPLQALAELGVVGVLLVAGLVAWAVWRLGRMSAVLAVLALQPMVDYVLAFHLVVAVAAVTLGATAATAKVVTPQPPIPQRWGTPG